MPADRIFRVALASHVAKHQHHPLHCSAAIHDRRGAVGNRKVAPVASNQHRVIGEVLHFARGQCRGNRNGDGQAGLLMNDPEDFVDRLAERLVAAPTGHPLGDVVHAQHAAGGVGGNHRVANRHQGRRQALLAARQGLPAGLNDVELATNEQEGQYQHRNKQCRQRGRQRAYLRPDFALLGGTLLKERPFFGLHLFDDLKDPFADFLQRHRPDVIIRCFLPLRLDQFLDAPGDRDALLKRFVQPGQVFLLPRVVGNQFAQTGNTRLARYARRIPFAQVRRVGGQTEALRAELGLQGCGSNPSQLVDHLAGMRHPRIHLLGSLEHLPGRYRQGKCQEGSDREGCKKLSLNVCCHWARKLGHGHTPQNIII